jgi:hypothetical protein
MEQGLRTLKIVPNSIGPVIRALGERAAPGLRVLSGSCVFPLCRGLHRPNAMTSNLPTPLSYKDAGVDIDAGDALVDRIKPQAK